MRVTRFVLNRSAFRTQILKGPETRALLNGIVGSDGVEETTTTRARARVYGSASDEAKNGTLSREIGGWHV